jgi:hypothetical protein
VHLALLPLVRGAAVVAATAVVSCSRAVQTGSPPVQTQPLSSYLSQRLIVTPTSRVRVDTMGWVQRLGGARSAARQLDSTIAQTFSDRAIGGQWTMPAELARAYDRNRSYASDPYNLATDPLRPASFVALSRYGEPLASQLRTMIALHEDARFVLLPVELRFEREPPGATLAVMRAVIVDARTVEARWVADIRGNPAADPVKALASVASRLADQFMAP